MASPTQDRLYGVTGGTAIKAPVVVATTAAITLSATQTIDGVAVVADDRVLVKDQADTTKNGIYVVASGSWTRDFDANDNLDLVGGTIVYVTSGTTNADTSWKINGTGPITIDTDAIVWVSTLAVSGVASIAGNTIIGSTSVTPIQTLTVYSSDTGGNLGIQQTGAYNSGEKGGLVFNQQYTSGGTYTHFSRIDGGKENTSDGNYAGWLGFYTRVHGGAQTLALSIDSSQNATFAGIGDFSAAGAYFGTAAAANLLDDYEEGTWTPLLSDLTNDASVSDRLGRYTKVGNRVMGNGFFSASSLGSMSGDTYMEGLPFTANSTANNLGSLVFTFASGLSLAAAGYSLTAYISNAQSYAPLLTWDSTGGTSSTQASELTATTALYFTFSYEV